MDFKMRWCDRLYCSDCGSDNVVVRLGWTQKDDSVGHPLEVSCDEECCRCNNCGDYWGKDLKTLPELWREFTIKVSRTDDYYRNGYLKSPLMNFEAGTPTDEIVDWFEERCPNHSVKDLIDYDL